MITRKLRFLVGVTIVSLFCGVPVHAQFEQIKKKISDAVMPKGEPKQIAYFKIKGELAETPINMPPLFGDEPPLSLKALLERFKEARLDSNVVAIMVDVQEAQIGLAQL